MSSNDISRRDHYPSGHKLKSRITRRHRIGKLWRFIFYAATVLAIVILAILLINVINQSFGLVAMQNEVSPDELGSVYFSI